MTVRVDPEQNETRALFSFVDLDGRRVLEIGCGDGRLTCQCADRAARVTAIEPAHRLVGPGGSVVDIHPVPGTATVEVYRSGEVVFADSASASDGEGEVQADAALAQVVARGLFAAERRAEFDFRVYASSPRELRDFLAEADAHSSPSDGEMRDAYQTDLYERVERITAAERTETEVAYHERVQITRLTPIGPEY